MKKLKESKYYNCCDCGNIDCPGKPNEGICNSKENNTGQIESMDRQSMLDKIYKKIADKTLSFGCKIFLGGQDIDICTGSFGDTHIFGNNYKTIDKGRISKIIGHPISLARVLSVLGEYSIVGYNSYIEIDNLKGKIIERKLLTDSGEDAMLDDQSDETIRAILTLLSE